VWRSRQLERKAATVEEVNGSSPEEKKRQQYHQKELSRLMF
jgi:hypothetical protein